jgi:hypothetical protein
MVFLNNTAKQNVLNGSQVQKTITQILKILGIVHFYDYNIWCHFLVNMFIT